jgi:hypothetical protein
MEDVRVISIADALCRVILFIKHEFSGGWQIYYKHLIKFFIRKSLFVNQNIVFKTLAPEYPEFLDYVFF